MKKPYPEEKEKRRRDRGQVDVATRLNIVANIVVFAT